MDNPGNGKPNGEQNGERAVDTLVLTYDRARDMLDVGGKCNSLDLMLDILGRATRVIENKWRIERAKELRQMLEDEQRTKALVDQIGRSRG